MEMEHEETLSLAEIAALLSDPVWQVRARAVQLLVPYGDAFPSHLLKKALLDEQKGVRIAALEVCTVLPQHIPVALVAVALSDPYWSVRAAAASALGAYGDQAPLAHLIAIVDDFAESSLVRSSALQSVGKIQGRDAFSRLLQALQDPVWHVREMAALLLGGLGEREAIPMLIEVFHNDPDPFVRSATIIALGRMKDETVEAVLRDAATDAHQYVRDAARQALEE